MGEAGVNRFVMSLKEWVNRTESKGIIAKAGRNGGTYTIKQNFIPPVLTNQQISYIYANEADVLNMDLFGMTAKEWRNKNAGRKGNLRDYASINKLICLSNMKNIYSALINDGYGQRERLVKLNQIAIQQMSILENQNKRSSLE